MLKDKEINFLENNTTFFNKLSSDQKKMFIDNSFHSVFNKKDLPHISENECSGFIIVLSGVLRVYLTSADGKEITLYKLLDGDSCIFTASCIFNNVSFNVNVEALLDTDVIILPSKDLDYLSKSNIEFGSYLLQLTQSKMSEVMYLIEQIVFKSFDKRLKEYLADFNSSTIETTHSEIAKDLGTAREVVSRMLKHFENEGMIKMKRGVIEIINLK